MSLEFNFLETYHNNVLRKYEPLWDNSISMRNKKNEEWVDHENGKSSRKITRNHELFLFLDTCVWINLAKKGKMDTYHKIFDLHFQNDALLLKPDQLSIEWDRNKERAIVTDQLNNYKDMINKAKALEAFLSNSGQDSSALKTNVTKAEQLKTELVEKVANLSMAITGHLMDRGIKIPTTNELKLKAANLALEKKAPFHKNKNSFGDALLFLSCMEFLPKDSELYFITDNTTDFSIPNNPTQLHEDLQELADSYGIKVHFSIDPNKTVNDIIERVTDKDYIAGLELRYQEIREKNLPKCPQCSTLMELTSRFDGRGHLLYHKCDTCSHTIDTGNYRHDYYN